MDSTLDTSNQHRIRLGRQSLLRAASHQLHHWAFRRAIPNFRYLFPMASSARESLVGVYGVPRERCFVTLAPQDTARGQPSELERPVAHVPFRLLYVTNDFQPKRGLFLLDYYNRLLRVDCTLTIVSNDPVIEVVPLSQ
ncbi:MAG: hypothetical protein IT169_14060 [Bryobacterales bacterium]|nr:hypothetical protein [Bryobacterales bacterium]